MSPGRWLRTWAFTSSDPGTPTGISDGGSSMTKEFWLGVGIGPVLWITVLWLLYTLFKQREHISKWYKGLPFIQWPALFLIVMGCKVIMKKNCKTMKYDNRLWISPETEGFKYE
jgi:hypothetical protein